MQWIKPASFTNGVLCAKMPYITVPLKSVLTDWLRELTKSEDTEEEYGGKREFNSWRSEDII